jgi:replicative DNA helicase
MKSETKIQGIRCNISAIDACLNGFQKGKLYFIAGRPGMGKSAVTINITNEIAKKYNVLYFSLEMTAEEIGLRRLAIESFVDMANIERGILNDQEVIKMTRAADRLSKYKMLINDIPGLHIQDIYRMAKRQKLRNQLDMLVIDHIGLVRAEGDTVREQVTNICIQLKNIAKELEIPVLALSQLNRGVEQRADKRPQLSDLKESSGIEENADVVMLLYRDEYYNAETEDKGIIEVDIAKQRGGRTGVVKLLWKPEIQLVRGII